MFWTVSHFRAGDLVEVRSKEEILSTLDERGCVENMPFMPEMMQFCGQRFRVRAVAHKTCETARQTWKGRRLRSAVHLEDLRCDGAAHGGCEAACTLFWKDVWLKPAGDGPRDSMTNGKPGSPSTGCTTEQLVASTQSAPGGTNEAPRYVCQATKVFDATEPLAWWDLRQYALDVWTGNHPWGRVLRVMWLAWLRWLGRVARYIPRLGRLYAAFNEWMHRRLTGRGAPSLFTHVQPCVKTPTGRLDLKPGELVRVKTQREIEATLDESGSNRGLSFDRDEMAPYCGRVFRVQSSVTKLVDEMTGQMRNMKQPCIILEGVVCRGEYARCRLNCPRGTSSYWRELWLERVEVDPSTGQGKLPHQETVLVERLD